MRRFLRALPLLLVVPTFAAGPAVAQDEPPPAPEVVAPEVVAQVGAEAIGRAEFDEWLAQATHAQFRRPVELVPPRYRQCVAATRAERAAKDWRRLSPRALRKRCRRQHRALRRQVLTFLVQSRWVEQEAVARGIQVSDERVDRVFRRQKRQAFPTERAYRRFLRRSGSTESHIKYRVRLDLLQTALTRIAMSDIEPVTKRDIARYRARHRRRFAGMRRAEANRWIRALLLSGREQRTLARFIADFRNRYVAITWCAPGHRIDECGASTPVPPAPS